MKHLEELYEGLGDERVRAETLTRRAMLQRFDPASTIVWHLWMASRDFADAHHVRELPLASFSPKDELAREWIDRVRALVRGWRIDVERGVRR